ncbi:hypothetical protein XENOCAPTIV_027468, partial [Xenoophorus captivus]
EEEVILQNPADVPVYVQVLPLALLPNPSVFSGKLADRNNLTVIDTIVLHGRGTTEGLKVAGKPPGQGSSLRFKMTEALLKDCTESKFKLLGVKLRDLHGI